MKNPVYKKLLEFANEDIEEKEEEIAYLKKTKNALYIWSVGLMVCIATIIIYK